MKCHVVIFIITGNYLHLRDEEQDTMFYSNFPFMLAVFHLRLKRNISKGVLFFVYKLKTRVALFY